MGVIVTVLTIILVVMSLLLVILILLQSDKSSGMGILGGGGSQSAFGSSTADVLTKITGTFVAFFFIISLGLSAIEARRPKSVVDTLPDEKKPASLKMEDLKMPDANKDANKKDTKADAKSPTDTKSQSKEPLKPEKK